MSTTLATAPVLDPFASWAAVYDDEPNPIVHLEGRYLRRMLPDLTGRYVLDVGCGTGRNLRYLASKNAASLQGFDPSSAMLQVARRKVTAATRLTEAALPALPVEDEAGDCVLASLVLGYVSDLSAAFAELARVVRPGGDLFVSDVHPTTAMELGWTRGRGAASSQAKHWPLLEVEACAQACGFALAARILPEFGEPEFAFFAAQDKQDAWQQAACHPAVYLLHLRKEDAAPQAKTTLIVGGCALGPEELVAATITLQAQSVHSILCDTVPVGNEIDLSDYLLLPGLINAHDHLEFALFPRLGHGPYVDATAWAQDIQVREQKTIARHRQVPMETSLWWGVLRNTLCGVTTICHHNALHSALLDPTLPSRVLAKYGWAHSLTFPPRPEEGLRHIDEADPFFIHAGEGVSPQSADELQQLEQLGALDSRTVVIHGLALDREGVASLNRCGAALAICPLSNLFLFEQTHAVSLLRTVDHLLLGSDSPLTSPGDLLDEVRTVSAWKLDPEQIYAAITEAPASFLGLSRGAGSLRVGARADLIGIKQRRGSPAAVLGNLSWRDVELVLRDGEVVLASELIYQRLPGDVQETLAFLRIEDEIRWLRAPVAALLKTAEAVLGRGNVFLNGRRLGHGRAEYAR